MPGIICSICGISVGHLIHSLTSHLHSHHNVIVTRKKGYKCGQEGCAIEYHLYSSLKRHLLQSHADVLVASGDDTEESDGDENMELGVDDDVVAQDREETDQEGQSDFSAESDDDVYYRNMPSLSKMAAHITVDLGSNSAVTGTVLSKVFDYLSRSFSIVVNDLKAEVKSALQEGNVTQEIASDVLKKFNVKNPFDNFDSIDQSIALIKNHYHYVEPTEVHLGERIEMAKDRSGDYIPKVVRDNCQYNSILQVINLVMSNDIIRELVFSEADAREGYMNKYRDGEHFKNHPLFSVIKGAIQLQIYYDDLEVVNPLGSRTKIHKLAAFYFRILNLPHYINSALGGVHLFLLCYTSDLQKYSFQRVLQPFLNDLKRLEIGFTLSFKGKEYEIKGTIASVCGDALAVHELFGLLGPQCKLFCRECLISRDDLLAGRTHCEEYRNRGEYAIRLQRLEANPTSAVIRTETGLKEDCALHQSAYFHITENHVFDAMHDFLEGTCQFVVKLVLNHYLENHVCSVDFLNGRIHSFDYGDTEVKNKPSANLTRESLRDALRDHTLKQKASQMILLVRILPFMLSDIVPVGDPHMKLILLLLDIMSIIFAPRIHNGTVPLLEVLIQEHNNLLLELFPQARFINKLHHMTHYPRFIRKMGPAVHHSCMRYEAKHHDLSRHGAVVCNFRNLPKTLARLCQIIQTRFWGDPETFVFQEINCSGGQRRMVADLPYREKLVAGFDVIVDGYVFVPRIAEVFGTEYRKNLFVVVSSGIETEEALPIFGKISDVVIVHSSVAVLVLEIWSTLYYEDTLRSYRVENNAANTTLRLTSDLQDYRPISPWKSYRDSYTYLCPRTSFF